MARVVLGDSHSVGRWINNPKYMSGGWRCYHCGRQVGDTTIKGGVEVVISVVVGVTEMVFCGE